MCVCVHIDVSVISVGIITDWLELSDVAVKAGSLCCHWENRGVLVVTTCQVIQVGTRSGNNGLVFFLLLVSQAVRKQTIPPLFSMMGGVGWGMFLKRMTLVKVCVFEASSNINSD